MELKNHGVKVLNKMEIHQILGEKGNCKLFTSFIIFDVLFLKSVCTKFVCSVLGFAVQSSFNFPPTNQRNNILILYVKL